MQRQNSRCKYYDIYVTLNKHCVAYMMQQQMQPIIKAKIWTNKILNMSQRQLVLGENVIVRSLQETTLA